MGNAIVEVLFDDEGINPGEIKEEKGTFVADSLRNARSDIAMDNYLQDVEPFFHYRSDGYLFGEWTLEVTLTPPLLLYKGHTLINLMLEYTSNASSFLYQPKKWVFELRRRAPDKTTGDVVPVKHQVHAEHQTGRDLYQRMFITISTVVNLGLAGWELYYRTLFTAQRGVNARLRIFLTFNSDKGLVSRQGFEWLDGDLVNLFTDDETGKDAPPGWEVLFPEGTTPCGDK